ncbi:MAG: hypothetical protein R3Y24_15880 [Eubacteriales bacterium]
MTNIFFPEEKILENDLFFVCYMVERIARRLKQKNSYIVNTIGKSELERLLSLANVLHSLNPLQVEDEWIEDYGLVEGVVDLTDVDHELVNEIPTATQIGKVYKRLIVDTTVLSENYADGIIRVYNNDICSIIDNYNGSAYYEPSYIIAKAYYEGGF